MKIIIIYIIVNFSLLYSQSSSLSMYGNGEFMNNYDAASVASGESKYFAENSNGYSLSSLTNHWKSKNTFILMSLKFSENNIADIGELVKNNFSAFVVTFPFNDTKAFSFGMNPLFRSDIKIEEDGYEYIPASILPIPEGSDSPNPLAFNSSYSFSGGISEAFITYSLKVNDNLSLGLRWSKIFGTTKYEYVLDIYNVLYNNSGMLLTDYSTDNFIYKKHQYSSSRYLIEMKILEDNFEFAFSYGKSKPLKIKQTEYFHVLGIPYEQLFKDQGQLYQSGLGLKYNVNENLNLIAESHYNGTFKSYEFLNIFSYENPNVSSVNLGVNYKYKNPKINSRWNHLNFRMGFLNKKYIYNSFTVLDRGFTMGFGVEYLENRNVVDFAIKFGNRTSEYLDYNEERYFNFYFTFLTGEKWFSNERK